LKQIKRLFFMAVPSVVPYKQGQYDPIQAIL